MSLFESILRVCDAEKYLEKFKLFNIDAFTLKILNEDDLKVIGIEKKEIRERIIKHVKNLKIPAEQMEKIKINRLYVDLAVNQMSLHIHRHLANLSIAVNRKEDADVCNIKLKDLTKCLNECVERLENQLDTFTTLISQRVADKKYEKEENQMKLGFMALTGFVFIYAIRSFM